jgi:hypothetical protein
MRVHLVTYATPRFRHREWILGLSARLAGVADTVTAWTPKRLLGAGFEQRCQGIALSERGSGFWAWKPFIIAAKLREVPSSTATSADAFLTNSSIARSPLFNNG